MTAFVITLALLSFLAVSAKRLLRYLRFFQQEEYDASRFFNWYLSNRAFDKRISLALICAALVTLVSHVTVLAGLLLVVALGIILLSEPNPVTSGKIKLNLTARAQRIYLLAFMLFVLLFIWILTSNFGIRIVNVLLLIQTLPLTLVLANFLLTPLEKYTKNKYKQQAIEILARINPYVIGITGSYGKTSVKAALGEVLNNVLAPTFCPPKSINTEMGITRQIRENLKPQHKYAVIEMGAYNVGSIKRLCALTPPQAAIVTVVGIAHLERFGSPERVFQAKAELAQALPKDGILVCNGDDPGARKMSLDYPSKTTLLYGFDKGSGHLDCFAQVLASTTVGTSFQVTWQDKTYQATTMLLGTPALSNVLAVFTMACALGADPEFVLASISNIKPVDNRLQVTREGHVTFIRDAYNSNPTGFLAALNVLKELPAKRRILMTPGMIELGAMQFEKNQEIGRYAASVCDLALIVGPTNQEALVTGLKQGSFNAADIIICPTRTSAFAKLNEIMQTDDLILIENDLTDLYELTEAF